MPYNQNKTNYRTLFAEMKQISTNSKMPYITKAFFSQNLLENPEIKNVVAFFRKNE